MSSAGRLSCGVFGHSIGVGYSVNWIDSVEPRPQIWRIPSLSARARASPEGEIAMRVSIAVSDGMEAWYRWFMAVLSTSTKLNCPDLWAMMAVFVNLGCMRIEEGA